MRTCLKNMETKRDYLRKLKKLFIVNSFKLEQTLKKFSKSDLKESERNLFKILQIYWKEVE